MILVGVTLQIGLTFLLSSQLEVEPTSKLVSEGMNQEGNADPKCAKIIAGMLSENIKTRTEYLKEARELKVLENAQDEINYVYQIMKRKKELSNSSPPNFIFTKDIFAQVLSKLLQREESIGKYRELIQFFEQNQGESLHIINVLTIINIGNNIGR